MSLETDLTDLLRTICPRTFCDAAPANTERPYVTYQQIGGDVIQLLDRTVPSKENATIQIGVWSDGRIEAKTMIKQIEAAMITTTAFQASAIAATSADFDSDNLVYSNSQDFSVWADR